MKQREFQKVGRGPARSGGRPAEFLTGEDRGE